MASIDDEAAIDDPLLMCQDFNKPKELDIVSQTVGTKSDGIVHDSMMFVNCLNHHKRKINHSSTGTTTTTTTTTRRWWWWWMKTTTTTTMFGLISIIIIISLLVVAIFQQDCKVQSNKSQKPIKLQFRRHHHYDHNHKLILDTNDDTSISSSLLSTLSTSSTSTKTTTTTTSTTIWKFKILQLTDLHLGEDEFTNWGPEQDRKTWITINNIINYENNNENSNSKIDLIVLSGDQLTGNNCKSNATKYYQLLGEKLTKYNIPWAMIFGNHDDMDYEIPYTNQTIPAKYKRTDLLKIDQSFPLSLTKKGNNNNNNPSSNIFGTSNYVLDVHIHNNPILQIYFFDSGGGSIPQQIKQNQIDWFLQTINNTTTNNNNTLPAAIAFQHIPTHDFSFSSTNCKGYNGDKGIAPIQYDAGIISALNNTKRISFLAVGHNHGNDYCCPYSKTLSLCFGRHSGHGGYGSWKRGARIYELEMIMTRTRTGTKNNNRRGEGGKDNNNNYYLSSFEWESWVRLESGGIIHRYSSKDNNNNRNNKISTKVVR